MVAINSLTMLFVFGPLGGLLLGVGRLPVPWQALLLSIGVYVALPLVAGYVSRRVILATRGQQWFEQKFLHTLTPITIIALLATLVLLFSFKGETILAKPLTILWIAIPAFRVVVRGGLGDGRRSLDRGAGDADADLFAHPGVVSRLRWVVVSPGESPAGGCCYGDDI